MSRRNRLFMTRPDLHRVPQAPLADGFTLCPYRPGDDNGRTAIVRMSLNTPREAALREGIVSDKRVFLAFHDGRAVGSAAAFRQLCYGERTGYLGMLAVMPAYRQRGLGAALLAACLHDFQRLGWRDAVLDTNGRHLPAIRLYLRFGFQPVPETARELAQWREALATLGRPKLAAGLKWRAPYSFRNR